MSLLATTKKASSLRAKIALMSAVGLGLAGVPVALAGPAQAATASSYACSVTPVKPAFYGHNSSGVKQINYPIRVSCWKNRVLNIQQEQWEDDYSWTFPFDGNDRTGTYSVSNYHVGAGQTKTINVIRTLQNTEPGNEEVFHQVRFQEGADGLWSPWTGWKKSATTSVPG